MSTHWPDYWEPSLPNRTYAYDNGNYILTEHGQALVYETWEQLRQIIYDNDLILLTNDMLRYLKLGAVNDTATTVLASESSKILMYSIRFTSSEYNRKKIRCIIPALSWQDSVNDLSPQKLPFILREAMNYCGAGDRATPSSLGRAIARQVYQLCYLPKHRKIPRILEKHLRAYSPTERVQSIETNWHSNEAWEYDLDSAYIMGLQSLPTGQVYSIFRDDMNEYEYMATWFRWCHVFIPKNINLSPIHKIVNGSFTYPTIAHSFGTWLWKEQVESARELGMIIVPHEGWMWEQLSSEQTYVVDKFLELKSNATPRIRKYVKKSLLAYIGRFGMKTDRWEIVDYFDPRNIKLFKPVIDVDHKLGESRFTNFYLMLRSDNKGGHLHWQKYIVQKTNNEIYRIGNLSPGLVAINFDSLITSTPLSTIPNGTKQTRLTNITIPYPRAIMSDQKTRLPGIKT